MHPSNLIRSRLGSDFERAVYDAALKSFNQLDNPLRVNNYATALGELGRIHLEAQAPDERIKQCAWFEQKYNELNKPVIERAQRVKYAVQGELEDEFVVETLGIEIGRNRQSVHESRESFEQLYAHHAQEIRSLN
jgi:hypothetical protein